MMQYQKLLPEHAKAYRALRLESLEQFPQFFGANIDEQRALPELRLERFINQQDTNNFVVGAFAHHQLVGICAFVAANDVELDATGTLIQMYVQTAFHGQGIGLGLTKQLVAEVTKLGTIKNLILEVVRSNQHAKRVYEQAGFRVFEPEQPNPSRELLMIFRNVQ